MRGRIFIIAAGEAKTGSSGFPTDVRAWTGSNLLIRFALNAAQGMHWPERESNFSFCGESHRSTLLLALLASAYAVGVMDSQDLQRRLRTDRDLRYLAANNYPDWTTLRRFRRLHRPALQFVLTELLRQVWITQPDDEIASPAWPDFALEAATRINAAILADASAIDE